MSAFPDGFKAPVVCHSKLAAIRYQKAIRDALTERLEQEKAKAEPDAALIARIAFLKVAVVVSSDATNEPAVITEARREAKRWNAVENFCKPFDLDDADKALTGIGFLVVCDMLLTGFDAPIEQVMYIDKRLKEHNLLQAIARVNRVAKGKQRGFIVDYICASARDDRDPWRFIALARAKHSAKRPSRKTESDDAHRN